MQARRSRLAIAAFGTYAFAQLWLPVRDTAFAGHVGRTEEGREFSWRRMLYSGAGNGRFPVVAPDGGVRVADHAPHLDPVQAWLVFTKPEMLLRYAHRPSDRHAAEGMGRVRIHADVGKSVNGKPWRRFVAPKTDLAAVGGFHRFGDEPWLLRPERAQAANPLLPDRHPPIASACFGATIDSLGHPPPSEAGNRSTTLAPVREAGE